MTGFLRKLFGKKQQDIAASPRPDMKMLVENQNGCLEATLSVVEDMLQEMFIDDDQFVTLSLPVPTHEGVRFVQACRIPDGIDVQLGMGEGTQTKLVERICTEDECMRIFRDFFDTLKVEDLECYTPVQRI